MAKRKQTVIYANNEVILEEMKKHKAAVEHAKSLRVRKTTLTGKHR